MALEHVAQGQTRFFTPGVAPDPRGTEEYNLGLGSRRAANVGTYLERLGVGQPQLAVTTRGSLDAAGTDESGWSKDRRVDVQLKQD